jgi:hypothetical protein
MGSSQNKRKIQIESQEKTMAQQKNKSLRRRKR